MTIFPGSLKASENIFRKISSYIELIYATQSTWEGGKTVFFRSGL